LAMMPLLVSFRKVAYGGQMLLGLLAVLALLFSGSERWRGKFPAGTGVAVAVFVAVFILNAFFSVDPARTVASWPFRFWLLMSLPIGLAFIDTQPVRNWGLYALMAGTGIGFLTLLLDLWQDPSNWRPSGYAGITEYGMVVSLAMPVLLAHLLNLLCRPKAKGIGGRSGRGLVFGLLLAVNICVVGLLLNGTRVAIISAAATTAFLAVSFGRRLSLRAVCALLTLLLAAALTFACRPQTFSRVASLTEFNPPAPVTDIGLYSDDPVEASAILSTWQRKEMWRRALKVIPEHLIIGQGFHTIPNDPDPDTGEIRGIFHFHSTYLQFAAETGVLGLLALLGLFAPGLRLALKRFGDPDQEVRMWSRIAIALTLALAIHAATDYLLFFRLVLYLYALLTAWAWTRLSPTSSTG